MGLRKADVTFDPSAHTYALPDGTPLSGVTPVVEWMFPDTYRGVPQAVLDRAAERGHLVHAQCQMAYNLGMLPDGAEAETAACVTLTERMGLRHLASEYLVSDGAGVASSIDIVFEDYSLADIKTTSKVHTDNVTLQLSIYAWLFELQNPGLRANRLYVIWLPQAKYGEPAVTELRRVPAADCGECVRAFLRGDSPDALRGRLFPCHTPATDGGAERLPATLRDAEAEIARIDTELKALQEKRDRLTDGLLALMEGAGVMKWEGGRLSLTYIAAGIRKSLDTARLRAEHPDICAEYQKETATKATVRITVKKQDKHTRQ